MSQELKILPPRLPLKFLRWFCHPDMLEDVEGDVSELFTKRSKDNKWKARFLFILDVLLLLRPGMIRNFEPINRLINYVMIKNYLKITLRNALRYKGFTLLNLLGLVVGIASSILILLWVDDEINVDKFHVNGDRIFQLFRNMHQGDGMISTTSSIPKPAADLMEAEYPEVDQIALLSWSMEAVIAKEDNMSKTRGRVTNQEFLDMFSFPFLVGDIESALNDPSSIVISRTLAERYYGTDWKEKVLATQLRIDDLYDLTVSGVFEDPGENSSLQFEWLASVEGFIPYNLWVNNWGNGSFSVYFTVDNAEEAKVVGDRIRNVIIDNTKDNDLAGHETLIVHKFQDYYLHSNFDNGVISGGRIDYVKIMTIVAILILIVACVNFMNLATARSGRRSKEIGLRKVMGAHRNSISIQFFLEALFFSFISVILSVVVVLVLLPYFNVLVDKSLFLDFTSINTWYFLVGVGLIVGILSGSYPAILLPTFNIIMSLKGTIKQSGTSTFLRKGLVVFQFGISTLLIIGTAVIYKQLDYVLNKDLGLNKENLVIVRMDGDLGRRLDTYRNELLQIPEVMSVTAASGNPIDYGRSTSSASWEGKNDQEHEINILMVDQEFVDVMGMELLAGRGFQNDFADSTNFIINEVAAGIMGFDDPINKDLSFWGVQGKIIGVIKNFHMSNLYDPIAPLIIANFNTRFPVALVRIKGNPNNALLAIEDITKKMNPIFDFEYEFMDEAYADSYSNEQTVSVLINIFSAISILISCLGLLGLSSYSAEQRAMEIGVRKVHGASVSQILVLLTKDYSRLMLMAFVLAIPFGYYFMQQWLNDFEFRTTLDPMVFIIAGVLTFIIGVVTVSAKSYQAATVNPTNSLKDE